MTDKVTEKALLAYHEMYSFPEVLETTSRRFAQVPSGAMLLGDANGLRFAVREAINCLVRMMHVKEFRCYPCCVEDIKSTFWIVCIDVYIMYICL